MSDSIPNEVAALSAAALQRRREQIHRGLRRANTASVMFLMIVVGFCAAAIVQAFRAEGSAREASRARQKAEEQLWQSKLSLARSARLGGVPGRKAESLSAISAAATIHVSSDLRDEAVATLALFDLTEEAQWQPPFEYGALLPVFAPDLDYYAQGGANGLVALFHPGSDVPQFQFQGPQSPVRELRFNADGRLIGARFANGQLKVWSVLSSASLLTCDSPPRWHPGLSFDFSPDATRVAVADGPNGARMIELAQGSAVERLPLDGDVRLVKFQPQGEFLAVGISSNLVLWNLAEGRASTTLSHPSELATMDWHPDGRQLASACAPGLDISLWQLDPTNCCLLKGHLEIGHNLSFNHRGDLLMSSAWDGTTRFWRVGSGELELVSRAGFGRQFSPDDSRIAYVRENQRAGVWKVSRSSSYAELSLPFGSAPYPSGLDFSPDGETLAIANADGVHLFNAKDGSRLASAQCQGHRSVAFTADGRSLLVIGAKSLFQWDLEQSESGVRLSAGSTVELAPAARFDGGSAVHAGAELLTFPSLDNVYCVSLREPHSWWRLEGHGQIGPVNSTAISPDTNWLAASYWRDGRTMVWDTRTRQQVLSTSGNGGFVAFSPDNAFLLIGSPHQYSLLETGSWKTIWATPRRSPGELVGRGAFSPDGKSLALCPEVNQVRLVETQTGRHLARLESPTPKNIGWLVFSPDGKRLAASTFDREIQIWDLDQMRSDLVAAGLDWNSNGAMGGHDDSQVPGILQSDAAARRKDENRSRATGLFYAFAAVGVVVALFVGLFTLRYHQRMMDSYEEVELLVARRNRELESAQAELVLSQKMKALGTLAAGIAHDFNNLLSVIRMGNTLARRPDTSPEDKAESSAAVERAVEQGKKVVRSMLGYSRDGTQTRQAYSVLEVVDDVVLLLNRQFLGGLTLTLELNRDIPQVVGARGRLEQMLLNLVVNASEAMAGRGRLLIAVREVSGMSSDGEYALRPLPAERYIELVVGDTGPGIAADLRSRVFEPFFSTKARSATSGTGLGLSLVHSLAQQEGIGIRLETKPGRGTEFTLLIPVATTGAIHELQAWDRPLSSSTV